MELVEVRIMLLKTVAIEIFSNTLGHVLGKKFRLGG
jgi:hypothetical protein